MRLFSLLLFKNNDLEFKIYSTPYYNAWLPIMLTFSIHLFGCSSYLYIYELHYLCMLSSLFIIESTILNRANRLKNYLKLLKNFLSINICAMICNNLCNKCAVSYKFFKSKAFWQLKLVLVFVSYPMFYWKKNIWRYVKKNVKPQEPNKVTNAIYW